MRKVFNNKRYLGCKINTILTTCLSDSKLCLGTHWMTADMEDCSLVVETISDLNHVKVTAGLLHTFLS